ncbi:MAG: TRAP transporter small permease [Thermodesulfobacteriota bacterium]|jgi:TRAP-type C4-dicarboxylate transport system permease small subunit
MFQAIDRFINRLVEGFGLLAGCLLCLMIFMTFFESVARYVGYPTSWTMEFTEYALVYLVCLAISYAEKYDDHIRVDFFINLLPRKIKNVVEIFNYLCIVLLSITLTYYGFKLSFRSFAFDVLSPTPLRVPLFLVQSILPIGMAMMSVKSFLKFLSLIKEK